MKNYLKTYFQELKDELRNILSYWIKNATDYEHGEWYWRVDKNGIPDEREDKAGFWKCPYHNVRACMEIMRRIEAINN